MIHLSNLIHKIRVSIRCSYISLSLFLSKSWRMGEQLTAQISISNLHSITLHSRITLFRYVGFPSILSNLKYKSHTFLLYIILFYGVYILESFHIFDCKKHLQRKPTSYAGEINKSSVKASPSPLASTRKSCPHGTVPIQRTTKDDLLKDRNITNAFIKAHRNINSTDPLKHVNAGTPRLNQVNNHHLSLCLQN